MNKSMRFIIHLASWYIYKFLSESFPATSWPMTKTFSSLVLNWCPAESFRWKKRIHAQFVFYLDVQPLDANMIIYILIIKIHVNKKMDKLFIHVASLQFLFEMVC